MSDRKTVQVYSVAGAATETTPLPNVFDTPVRADLVQLIYTNLAKNQMQPHGTTQTAGIRPSAVSWGPGRAKARVPRVNGSGSNRNGQGAYANFCRGGHRFGPPSVQRRWFRPVPLKQRRYAVASAIAASSYTQFVEARGHCIKEIPTIPVVVADEIESITKTKQAVAALKALHVYGDVQRVIDGKIHRSSKGKMRRSAFKTKKGPLVVYANDKGVAKAFRNIPGVDVQNVSRLSLYQLAPGATLGRLVVWSQSAFKALDAIYESKKGFVLPHSLITNQDLERVAYSDEVLATLRPALQTFSVPTGRCPCRLGVACQEWTAALKQIEELRAAELAKTRTPEAIKALFEEVAAVQPPAPEDLSIAPHIYPGYFDSLHLKDDDNLEAELEGEEKAE
ncbi:ribosomal protein [Tritrichomonas foetus]|uniref:Large ribosomal subunit protein uL4 n=1 Tax=Tritrichomonas foetus TaxID=1144522 RepID=A0A1J4K7T0_9EUKA|nr:ribosomal protein [Tritrichomonas foetus]OHT07537.1 ribosomal protein [Tritrichomonas foetus]|eukprot:OHT07537.1 ribosomal protein [Tritrichomonas foetus]